MDEPPPPPPPPPPPNLSNIIPESNSTVSSVASSSTFSPPQLPNLSTSSSPPQTPGPSTPLPCRYPRSLGRVPLHRRGTSKTYERLEDLLREAGYKETRIFTPETDRVHPQSPEHAHPPTTSGLKSGVGVVFDFLTGFMSGNTTATTTTTTTTPKPTHDDRTPVASVQPRHIPQIYCPPPSPLAHKHRPRPLRDPDSPSLSRSTTQTSSLDSLPLSPSPSRRLILLHDDLPHQRPPSSRARDTPPPPHTYSKARAYLRHISSAPTMQQQQHPNMSSSNIRYRDLDDDCEDSEPPLPRTWLETVARAVLLGGPGAFIGGPKNNNNDNSKQAPNPNKRARRIPPALRQTRSSLSQVQRRTKSALTDQTNFHTRPPSAYAPALCYRENGGKGDRSAVEVSKTRVVCWSAPASRASSRERDEGGGIGLGLGFPSGFHIGEERRREKFRGGGDDGVRGRMRGKGRRRKTVDKDGVPTLARTRAEGDLWSTAAADDKARAPGASKGIHQDDEEDDEDGSDDDGELDLAKILVPSIRRNSIRSLRKHLASTPARPRRGRDAKAIRKGSNHDIAESMEEEEEAWGRGRKGGMRRHEDDDEEMGKVLAGLMGGSAKPGSTRSDSGTGRAAIPVWMAAVGLRGET